MTAKGGRRANSASFPLGLSVLDKFSHRCLGENASAPVARVHRRHCNPSWPGGGVLEGGAEFSDDDDDDYVASNDTYVRYRRLENGKAGLGVAAGHVGL